MVVETEDTVPRDSASTPAISSSEENPQESPLVLRTKSESHSKQTVSDFHKIQSLIFQGRILSSKE